MSEESASQHDRVVVRQLVPGSPADVFDAWVDAESVAVWMCPGDIIDTRAVLDARVGGAYTLTMQEKSGTRFEFTGTYLELDRPRRLVFTWISIMTDMQTSRVTVEFLPREDQTLVVLTHDRLPSANSVQMHAAGWITILAKLAAARAGTSR